MTMEAIKSCSEVVKIKVIRSRDRRKAWIENRDGNIEPSVSLVRLISYNKGRRSEVLR